MAMTEQQLNQFMAAQQAATREQKLYEFNAGSCEMNGKRVTPDPRKGKVVLSMESDGLLRFQWRLRHSDQNLQQYFVFPKGATWERVNECKDGRVYLLKFVDSDVRRFFWMQEPTSTAAKKDAEVERRVTSLINKPPKFGAPIPKDEEEEAEEKKNAATDTPMEDVVSTVTTTAGDTAAVRGTGLAATPVNVAEARGAVVNPAPAAVAPPAGAGTAATASASAPVAGAGAGAGGANALMATLNAMAQQLQARQESERQAQSARAGVEDVLDATRVQPLLDVDAGLVDALVEYLPEGQRSPEALRAQLRSPQLQQTMSRLTQLLNSEQFGQLMASLSLPASGGLGVDAFLAAIQQQAEKQNNASGKSAQDKPKDK